jgi:hypothetical protein
MVRKNNLNSYNLKLENEQSRIILAVIIILVIVLLFRKSLYSIFERIIIFAILFLLFLVLTKNLIITTVGSILIFLLINFNIKYTKMIENFQSATEEPAIDFGIFQEPNVKKSSDGIQELLTKINGGIELKEEDKKETSPLNIDSKQYSDDNKPNALKAAQKEAYELIDTVSALKDTITTLAPVLAEGKKLMSIFENLKI